MPRRTYHDRMRRRTGLTLGSIGAAALLSLTACAAQPAEEAPPVASSATPSPTPTEAAYEGPESRLDLTCDDALSIDALESFMGAPDPLVPVPVLAEVAPDRAASMQLGALVCEWDDGSVQPYWLTEPSYRYSIVLHVLPEGRRRRRSTWTPTRTSCRPRRTDRPCRGRAASAPAAAPTPIEPGTAS
ncbi:hypothetical protein GCM10025877_06130 [Agromyces mangrovi Wang et al. 2018]|nr:hypothetical protein GCM10025877_06130 [Agromyces mangrovi]